MEVLLLAVMGLCCIVCFALGAKIGQTAARGEKIELPSINPLNAIREHEDKKKAKEEQNRIDTILQNIENYDGTSRGQEDVPGKR